MLQRTAMTISTGRIRFHACFIYISVSHQAVINYSRTYEVCQEVGYKMKEIPPKDLTKTGNSVVKNLAFSFFCAKISWV